VIQLPQVEETPTRLPGECFSCKATQLSPGRIWFLDTDVDYFDTPAYRIQICNICFDLLANICGYIKIGEEVEQYKRAIAQREAEIDELKRYRNYIHMLGLSPEHLDHLMGLNSGNLEAESPDAGESRTEVGDREEGTLKSVDSGEARLFEPSDDKRVDELRPTEERSVNVTI
jgi:hypothetical protein